MSASTPDSRTCPQCNAVNYGGLPRCTKCGAALDASASTTRKPTFCGECGADLERGATFCGECGQPATAATNVAQTPASPFSTTRPPKPVEPAASGADPAASRWAPRPTAQPAAAPVSDTAPQKRKFCRSCGTHLKPGARFCNKCGTTVERAPVIPRALAGKPVVTTKPVAPTPKKAPPAKPRVAPPPAPVAPRATSTGDGWGKKSVRVIVPVVSMVATYFLTNKVLGPTLAQQFGDAGKQMGPMLVSMVVGGVARQITK